MVYFRTQNECFTEMCYMIRFTRIIIGQLQYAQNDGVLMNRNKYRVAMKHPRVLFDGIVCLYFRLRGFVCNGANRMYIG